LERLEKLTTMTKQKTKKGFTLIELLIAMSIFMIFLTVATGAYISIIRTQREQNETRKMYSEVRDFVDFLNQEVRNGKIDYECYANITTVEGEVKVKPDRCDNSLFINSGNNLMLISKDGLQSLIVKFEEVDNANESSVKLTKYQYEMNSWLVDPDVNNKESFFQNLKVENLNFKIYPTKDPNELQGDLSNQFQPSVLVDLRVKSKDESSNFTLDFQTLIGTRTYN
jgi:prepilin-type N-terminal cleavage/methylation domain-containing protein